MNIGECSVGIARLQRRLIEIFKIVVNYQLKIRNAEQGRIGRIANGEKCKYLRQFRTETRKNRLFRKNADKYLLTGR